MADAGVQILGLGVSTIDELLVLDHIPVPNEKQQIFSRTRQCGGLTGSALVAASRMGCACGYLVTLGTGELSEFLRREMIREGVRLFENNDDPSVEPFFSLIMTEQGTGERTILWDDSRARPPRIEAMERALVMRAGCLLVDHVYAEAIVEVVREARRAGVPVVGDFEREAPGSSELMDLTNHLILPLGYARTLLGSEINPAAAAAKLAAVEGRELACVTDGAAGAWYALGANPTAVSHQPIFSMPKIVDTTGCGDVFHGVYAAGLVGGLSAEERIRNAAAAAALKTQKPGAQSGAPTLSELEAFLRDAH